VTDTAKATITVDDKVVTFEGPMDFVDAQVARYMRAPGSSHIQDNSSVSGASTELPVESRLSEQRLIAEKQPRGHSETIAVLAFALAEAGATEFTEEDMKRAYIRAKVRPPKVVGQAIRDAKGGFDYIEYGKNRGTYRLSNHGERTVRFDMPLHNKENKG
jgi:hypothetical protein